MYDVTPRRPPVGACSVRIKSSTTVDATGSSPAVGSSYMMTDSAPSSASSRTTARASATRFRMPPDSSLGCRPSTPDRPTAASDSATNS